MSTELFRQLAREFNVSTSAVRRTLSQPIRDRRPTIVDRKQRIRARARELGYRSNAAARATATGRFGSLALLYGMDDGWAFLPSGLMREMVQAAEERGQRLILTQITTSDVSEDALPWVLREHACDGLIVSYLGRLMGPAREALEQTSSPVVWVNDDEPNNCVRPDDRRAGQIAAEALLAQGHRRIVYLFQPAIPQGKHRTHYSFADRLAGIRSTDAHVEDLARSSTRSHREDLQSLRQLIQKSDRSIGFVVSDPWAVTAVLAAAASLDLQIPRDLGLISIEWGTAGPSDLDRVVIPAKAVAEAAVDMLLHTIESREDKHRVRLVRPRFEPAALPR